MTLTITQGTTRTIRVTGIVDATGAALLVTGWSVRAAIRSLSVSGPVVAEWSSEPTGSQGTATASGSEVTLAITPVMSSAWTWTRGVLQVEITEPVSPTRVERIADTAVYLDREVVT